ncbi:cysteine desulfurase CsdA [Orbaceae bacterium ESL0721]|nr:cysteine desulfurase CsdA [Orbaceae bacterium ESL0721]
MTNNRSTQFEPNQFRSQFPVLNSSENGDFVYLDSAATSLKPQVMIDALQNYYSKHTATVARSLHKDAMRITADYDLARQRVAKFIGATECDEIIWTSGTTESINLIAQSYARSLLQPDDEIIVSDLEHHSNLIPWLIVAEQTGAKVTPWAINDIALSSLINPKTKIVAVTQMSNVTGYCPDLAKISAVVHNYGAVLVVDGAQGIVHNPINVVDYDIDFYAFSAHKLYGPTGVGALYGKKRLLASMPVWQGGGKMLTQASFTDFTPAPLPAKFEAGTPNIAGILAFSATLNWLEKVEISAANHYVETLADYATAKLSKIDNITIYSVPNSPLISFTIAGIHHNDIAILLSEQNIAIRTGELCAQPLMKKLGCQGVIRLSFMPYNNHHDIDNFLNVLNDALLLLK